MISKHKKYILTGTPGSGKTTLVRCLEQRGHQVVDEAATEVIRLAQASGESAPWTKPGFIEQITELQIKGRQTPSAGIQFFDRSPFCTLALAQYLNVPPPQILLNEIELIQRENMYQHQVFFIENLGYCEPTEARTISFEEALCFEKIHGAVYVEHGFELIKIPNATVSERAQLILSFVLGSAEE